MPYTVSVGNDDRAARASAAPLRRRRTRVDASRRTARPRRGRDRQVRADPRRRPAPRRRGPSSHVGAGPRRSRPRPHPPARSHAKRARTAARRPSTPAGQREHGIRAHLGRERRELVRLDVRGVADDEVDDAHGVARHRVSSRSPLDDVDVEAGARRVLPGERRRPRANGRSARPARRDARRLIASATAPVPVPTSTTTGDGDPAIAVERALDDDLGLRPRDEHAGSDDKVRRRKPAVAGQVLGRRTGAPAAQGTSERLGLGGPRSRSSRVYSPARSVPSTSPAAARRSAAAPRRRGARGSRRPAARRARASCRLPAVVPVGELPGPFSCVEPVDEPVELLARRQARRRAGATCA